MVMGSWCLQNVRSIFPVVSAVFAVADWAIHSRSLLSVRCVRGTASTGRGQSFCLMLPQNVQQFLSGKDHSVHCRWVGPRRASSYTVACVYHSKESGGEIQQRWAIVGEACLSRRSSLFRQCLVLCLSAFRRLSWLKVEWFVCSAFWTCFGWPLGGVVNENLAAQFAPGVLSVQCFC